MSNALAPLTLADGQKISFREVTPEDEPLVAEAIQTASERTLLHRFFTPLRGMSPGELRQMLKFDRTRGFCAVGEVAGRGGSPRIVCGARYVRLDDSASAELALTVHDDFQGRGVGRHLMKLLIEQARAEGVRTFVADVLATNAAMLRLLQSIAPHRRSSFDSGVCHVEFELPSSR